MALRKLYSQYLQPGETLPQIPDRNPVITIPEIRFLESISLLADTGTPVTTENPRSFETYGQNQGCILYKAMLPAGNAGTVLLPSLNDYARISIDGKHITTYDRRTEKGKWITGFSQRGQNIIIKTNEDYTVNISVPKREKETALEILVEAMGHVNYGGTIDFDRKGISGKVFLKVEDKTSEIKNWSACLLPLNSKHLSRVKFGKGSSEIPAFYRATFTLQETGDTFLDLSSWGKGVVWVNGHNLGRYWRIGPQQTLYLPAPWLKTGDNEIVVLELLSAEKTVVQGLANPILDQNQ